MEDSISRVKTPIVQQSPDLGGKAQIDLFRSDFDAVVYQKGHRVYVDRHIKCPCTTKSAASAITSCRNCGGTGKVFINRFETRMVLQGMNLETKFRDWTEDKLGMVKVSCLRDDHLSYSDRITVRDALSIGQEILYPRLIGSSYQARTIYNCIEIQEIFAFRSTGETLLRLEEDTHYTKDGDTLTFVDSVACVDDFTVSIRYKHNPQFLVIDLTRDIIQSPKGKQLNDQGEFPTAAVARRAHYVSDKQNEAGNYLLDNSYEVLDC